MTERGALTVRFYDDVPCLAALCARVLEIGNGQVRVAFRGCDRGWPSIACALRKIGRATKMRGEAAANHVRRDSNARCLRVFNAARTMFQIDFAPIRRPARPLTRLVRKRALDEADSSDTNERA